MKPETKEKFKNEMIREIKQITSKSKRLLFEEKNIDLVFIYYNKYREIIHKMMKKENEDINSDKKMDSHKMASAFLCSIIKAKPIHFNANYNKDELPDFLERTPNKQLGFTFALYTLETFNNSRNGTSEEQLILKNDIKVPDCINNGDNDSEYIVHFLKLLDDKTIELLDFENHKFDKNLIFYMSHIFFLIDKYSYYYNFSSLLKNKIKKYENP